MTDFIKEQISFYERYDNSVGLSDEEANYLAALRVLAQAEEALRSCTKEDNPNDIRDYYFHDHEKVLAALAAIDALGIDHIADAGKTIEDHVPDVGK